MKKILLVLIMLFFSASFFYGEDISFWKNKLSSFYNHSNFQKASSLSKERLIAPSYWYRKLAKRWKYLDENEKKELKPYLLRPDDANGSVAGTYSATEVANLQVYSTVHFQIHFVNDATSSNAPHDLTSNYNDVDGDGQNDPDYVVKMGDFFEAVYNWYKTQGFTPTSAGGEPVKSDGAIDPSGDGRYDIYIMNISAYGITINLAVEGDEKCSYIVMNNDFSQFSNNEDEAMLVTVFHEFFHAIQYSYNPNVDSWWLESTAVFMEDYISVTINSLAGGAASWNGPKDGDEINDYRQYIPSVLNNPYLGINYDGLTHQYGEVLFAKFLAENYIPSTNTNPDKTRGDCTIIRQIFENMDTDADSNATSDPLVAIDNVLKGNYNSTLNDAVRTYYEWLYFTGSRNPSSSIGMGLNGKCFEEDDGDDDGDANWDAVDVRATHSTYPIELQSVQTGVPYQLGANYLEFLPDSTYGKSFQLEFDGADKDTAGISGSWNLLVMLIKDDGSVEIDGVNLDTKNAGMFYTKNFGSAATYRKIVMIPLIISRDVTNRGFRYVYSTSLGNVRASDDNITSLYNYPNPTTNGTTTISFNIAKSAYATLTIYDSSGHKVKTLLTRADGELDAGFNPQEVTWDGTNDELRNVGNGVYFYRLVLEKDGQGKIGEKVGKLVILR